MTRALITGSSGFVGHHLINHLQAMGDEVILCDREDGHDILDGNALHKYFRETNPDVVYHLAGWACLLYTSPSPRDQRGSRMPSSA